LPRQDLVPEDLGEHANPDADMVEHISFHIAANEVPGGCGGKLFDDLEGALAPDDAARRRQACLA
jgi:hypothetical protein